MRRPVCGLDPMFATDFVPRIAPEDFFVLDVGLPLTKEFLEDRILFCRDLAKAAAVYVKHHENDDSKQQVKIAFWLTRCMQIKSDMDYSAFRARQLLRA